MARRFTVLTATSGAAPAGGSPGRGPELDEITLGRAQRGEEPACHALVRRYQEPVFQILGRVLGRHGRRRSGVAVADLAQETFLRVFRQLPTFSAGGSARLSTWILTIATRVAIDELRRRCPETLSEEEAGAVLVAASRADEEAHGHEAAALVERALSALPADWRAVLLLRIEHELEYQDIARALGIELGTVRSRLARAREALWEALAELREAP
jgi:RNA polymerase sigma-70 factor (ECF subfamily)